ncbi:MAG TPA: hypothetical protein VEB00_04870 [Clostridia bacterium]|nr:hypothetical protein [Clostridia bacterium]
MDITMDLDNIIDDQEKTVLRGVLNCQNNEELQGALTCIGESAMCEYLEMILGKQLPTRGDEIRERRLYHLLKHYFIDTFPSEREISLLFQLTDTGSRSLLRNVRTKFRYNLEEEIRNSIIRVLADARRQHDGSYNVITHSDNLLEELKRIADIEAVELQPIVKVKNSNGVHSIPEDTFNVLRGYYGVGEEPETAAAQEVRTR